MESDYTRMRKIILPRLIKLTDNQIIADIRIFLSVNYFKILILQEFIRKITGNLLGNHNILATIIFNKKSILIWGFIEIYSIIISTRTFVNGGYYARK